MDINEAANHKDIRQIIKSNLDEIDKLQTQCSHWVISIFTRQCMICQKVVGSDTFVEKGTILVDESRKTPNFCVCDEPGELGYVPKVHINCDDAELTINKFGVYL